MYEICIVTSPKSDLTRMHHISHLEILNKCIYLHKRMHRLYSLASTIPCNSWYREESFFLNNKEAISVRAYATERSINAPFHLQMHVYVHACVMLS